MASTLDGVMQTSRRLKPWATLALLVTAQSMIVLDTAIVNVALPAIDHDLQFSQASLQSVISAYAVVFGGALLLGGRLGDILGRRRVFILGLAVFSVSSLLCALAWSAWALVAFRAVQGLGAALLAPAVLSLLITSFEEGRERNVALGVYGAASGGGAAVGLLLGGALTTWLGWTWIFLINLPLGAIVIVLAPRLLGESRVQQARRRFDLAGAATVTAGLLLLVYAISHAAETGWSSRSTLTLLVASSLLLVAFVGIELRSAAPLLPLQIFTLRGVAAANATATVIAAIILSQLFLLTLYLQDELHYSALQTGGAFLALALTVVVFANVAQRLVTRLGPRAVVTTGLLHSVAALALLAQLPARGHYLRDLFPALLLGGVGLAFSSVPLTIAALAGVPRAFAGVASGLLNTSRQVGGAVGVATASTIAQTYGLHAAFRVLTALAVVGTVAAVVFLEHGPAGEKSESMEPNREPLAKTA